MSAAVDGKLASILKRTPHSAATGVSLVAAVAVPRTTHDTVYSIQGGRVASVPLARYRLPEFAREHALVAADGGNSEARAVLPLLAEVADRMAPWVSVHVVPRTLSPRDECDREAGGPRYVVDGGSYSSVGGLAFCENAFVLMSAHNPVGALDTLCHELLHVLWRKHLNADERAVLSAAVSRGAAWPGDYYGSTEERVARLFAHWCSSFAEGQPARPLPPGGISVDSVFHAIWSGALADEVLLADGVPDAAAHRARRGLTMPAATATPAPAREGSSWWGAEVDAAVAVVARWVGRCAAWARTAAA